MDTAKLRAWYAHRQGLDGRLADAKPADVLAQTGWARSIGGVAPYLTLFARSGATREAADAAVAKLEIHELPAARNCTYVVPASAFALALKVGQRFWAGGDLRTAYKLGVTEKEFEKLCDAVMKALAKGPLEPDEIRESVGSAVRSLGEEGRKKGVSTTLPIALSKLQAEGEIRRVPLNGRLDQQRYRYVVWRPNPLANFKLTEEEAAVELARRFFSWIGPASAAQFQTFSGWGVKAAKAAMEPLKMEPLKLETAGDCFMLPGERAELEAFKVPKDPRYTLVSGLDGIGLMRDGLKALMDPEDEKTKLRAAGIAGPSGDLPSHAILDRGRVVGLWEYDPETQSIAWFAFMKKNKDLEQAIARTEEFVRTQLGDARSFALDSPKSRAPRIEALRKAAGARVG